MPYAGTKLTVTQIASYARGAGFPVALVPMVTAIALAESAGWTGATNYNTNGSTDYGLWQINSIHRQILAGGTWSNPADNAAMAYQVYKEAGNKLTPWVTYNTGSAGRQLGTVTAALGGTLPAAETGGSSGATDGVVIGGVDSNTVAGWAAKLVGGATGIVSDVKTASKQVAWILLGIFLIIVGTVLLVRRQLPDAGDIAEAAAAIA